MSNAKIDAAVSVAEKLHRAEERVADAVTSVADFIAHIQTARAAAGFAHGVGHDVVTEGSDALGHLARAQNGLQSVHKQVSAIAKWAGIDISATGPLQKEPQDAGMTGGSLRAVS